MSDAAPEAWQELVRASSKLDRYRAVRRTQRVALIGVMVVALLGRAVVAFAGLPSALAFAFFPALLMILLLQRPSGTVFERKLIRLIGVLALVVAASVVVNQSSATAGLLLWASLATPFLMILGIRRAWPRANTAPALLAVFSVLLGVQALVIIAQAVFLGQTSDSARGLLADQGAGAHVLGLIGVGAAVYLGTMIAEQASLRRRVWPYGLVLLGLLMAWSTDTRQALLAFVLSVATYLAMRAFRLNATGTLLAAVVITVVAITGWQAMGSYRNVTASDFVEFKGETLRLIGEGYRREPERVFLGLAPGETASRVAWQGAGGTNLVVSLGIPPGAIASELLLLEQAKPAWRSSSFSSPWSTLLGVWGDLGILGLASYLLLWLLVAEQARRGLVGSAGMMLVAFLLTIGLFYNWLEEPVLLLFLSFALADSICRSTPATSLGDEVTGAGFRLVRLVKTRM